MEPNNLKKLKLLEAIADSNPTSQRELANSLQMSLGLVNSFIKRLVKKGYCKVTTIPKNRVIYMLTPAGAMEKTRLTYEYIYSSYQYFKNAKEKVQHLYTDLQEEGVTKIVFYGAGELADIALLAMTGTGIRLVGVVDPEREGEVFAHLVVNPSVILSKIDYDALLVTVVNDHNTVLDTIRDARVPKEKIRFF